MHILTAGTYTYISDNRYEAIYQENKDTWVLRIHSVQLRDSGLFECQLSSVPVISYFVQLTVLEPTVEILGDSELYVQSGSSLNLTCIISNLPSDSEVIRWLHGHQVLDYRSLDGHQALDYRSLHGHQVLDHRSMMSQSPVSIFTEKGELSSSYLIIHRLGITDGGQYSCVLGDTLADTIIIHVLKGMFLSFSISSNGKYYVSRVSRAGFAMGVGPPTKEIL